MNDLKMLHEIGAELDPPAAEPPERLHGRVLSAIAEPRQLPRRRAVRLGWRLAVAGGLAVALGTGGLIAIEAFGIGGRPPTAQAEAATILHKAALTAGRQPAVVPRADQFVFIESAHLSEGGQAVMRQQSWGSVDGTRDGLLRTWYSNGQTERNVLPGCRNGSPPCSPVPSYRGDLPTDTDAMYRFLYSKPIKGDPPDELAFRTVEMLLREHYVPPRSVAAMFNAVAKVPGATVDRDVVDAAGRRGVAVGWTFPWGGREELIFDARTYEYLGGRTTLSEEASRLVKGGAVMSIARLRIAIVDRAGQLPQ